MDFPDVKIQSMNMSLKSSVSTSVSPFTFDQQTYVHQGVSWECEVTLPPLSQSEAKQVEGFLAGLRGASTVFKLGNPLHNTTAAGNITGAIGDTAITASITGAVVGDYFEFNDHLYIITSISGSDYGIMPPLRNTASSSTVDFTYPKGSWILATNQIGWSIDNASIYSFTIPLIEAFINA